jgi:transposase, IS5 family
MIRGRVRVAKPSRAFSRVAGLSARMLRNGRRALPQAISGRVRGRLRRALDELAVTLDRTATIVAQTRSRLAGQMPRLPP